MTFPYPWLCYWAVIPYKFRSLIHVALPVEFDQLLCRSSFRKGSAFGRCFIKGGGESVFLKDWSTHYRVCRLVRASLRCAAVKCELQVLPNIRASGVQFILWWQREKRQIAFETLVAWMASISRGNNKTFCWGWMLCRVEPLHGVCGGRYVHLRSWAPVL